MMIGGAVPVARRQLVAEPAKLVVALLAHTPQWYYRREEQMTEITYTVPDMSCGHCKAAVGSELQAVPGVRGVDVDLETKLVVVRGDELDDDALRAAIAAAGYEAA